MEVLTFSNASLLSYDVENNFIGGGSFNINSIRKISIEGYIDSRVDNSDFEGVRETFQEINTTITNGHDYVFEDLVINGVNYGRGRVTSLSFSSEASTTANQVRIGSYSADIEIYEKGDLANMGGSYYQSLKEGIEETNYEYIEDISENFSFNSTEAGGYDYNHDVSVKFISGNSNMSNWETQARNLVKKLYYSSIPEFGLIENQYKGILNEKGRRTHNESFDLINLEFNFGENFSLHSGQGETDHTTKLSHTIDNDDAGNINITEQGEVKSMKNHSTSGWAYYAIEGADFEVDQSYGRCNTLFSDFASFGDLNGGTYHSLNSIPISLGRGVDSGAGTASYSIVYTNKQDLSGEFINDYSLSAQVDEDHNILITEDGSINMYGYRDCTLTGIQAYNNLTPDIEARTSNFYNQVLEGLNLSSSATLKMTDSNLDFPRCGKEIRYSKTYSNDSKIIHSGEAATLGLARVEVTTDFGMAMEKSSERMIANRGDEGELVHWPNQVEVGTFTVNVTAVRERAATDHYLNNPPLLKTEVQNILEKYALPEAYKLPKLIHQKINEYWVQDLNYSFSTDGEISLTLTLNYTSPAQLK